MKKIYSFDEIEELLRSSIHEKVFVVNFKKADQAMCLIIEQLERLKKLGFIKMVDKLICMPCQNGHHLACELIECECK